MPRYSEKIDAAIQRRLDELEPQRNPYKRIEEYEEVEESIFEQFDLYNKERKERQ